MLKLPIWSGCLAVAAAGSCLIAAATVSLNAQEIGAPPEDFAAQGDQNYEALTRGPMHEAFANPYVTNPEPGLIVEQQPPEPINEIPPEEMPEGENVVWIPGYWGWDPDASEFIWISGLWRNMPSEHRWVPGYWASVENGYQWIAGFWGGIETEELVYLPEPPRSLEQGPNIAPPEGDYFWIPGCWVWQEVSYDWRPGYWAPAVPDWVWIPDQYMWTPYGCVFVPGYWDYTFVDRGVMFAPVHFETAVIRQPTFQYVPTVVIDTAPLMMHLFVSPNYGHYYYGDYYAFQPARSGFSFYTWSSYGSRRSFYDPLLTYYQWSYGQRDINIVQRLNVWNQYFVRNESYRPPRTFSAQRQFLARIDRENIPLQASSLAFASPIQEFARDRSDQFRFQRVSEPRRQRIADNSRELRAFQQQRSEFEVAAVAEPGINPSERPEPGQDRGQRGQGQRRERRLQVPESTNVIAATRTQESPAEQPTTPGQDPTADQANPEQGLPGPGTPPPDRPTPNRQPPRGEGRAPADAGEQPITPGQEEQPGNRPDREPGDRPGRGEPGERPERGEPGDRPGRGEPGDRPGRGEPGDRPGRGEPGEQQPGGRPETPGQPSEGPNLPTPDAARPGQQPGEPGAPGQPESPPGDRPGSDRPGLTRPTDQPGSPDQQDRPGRPPEAGDRPDPRRPDAGRGGPGRPDLPEQNPEGPGAGNDPEGQQPQFPRFGVGRDRSQGPVGGEPGQPGAGPAEGASPDRQRGRRGFDPFGGLPPGADDAGLPQRGGPAGANEAPGAPGGPRPEARPDRRPGPQGPNGSPGLPGAGAQPQPGPPGVSPDQPRRGSRGGEARPGGPGGPQGRQSGAPPQAGPPQAGPPQAGPPQAGPPQAGPPQGGQPGGGAPPQAAPQGPQGSPPQADDRDGRGRGRGQGNGGGGNRGGKKDG